MNTLKLCMLAVLLTGAGCQTTTIETPTTDADPVVVDDSIPETPTAVDDPTVDPLVVFPVEDYLARRTFKSFGEYIQDRFTGYHVADDIEFVDVEAEVPVMAIADGVVERSERVGGYGGFIRIRHEIDGEVYRAIYGHLDLEGAVKKGDVVAKGQQIARLGDHVSEETDGTRKHLHFGLYQGDEDRVNGYAKEVGEVAEWVNPQDVFAAFAASANPPERRFGKVAEPGLTIYGDLSFTIPEGFAVEYIPSIEALNVFHVAGSGTARSRSEILIRYFDASQFLTLSTVEIYDTQDMTVGTGDYTARRYDIEKKPGVANFADQPLWRNERHVVTDFRGQDGFTRYFVVAASPDLDADIYASVLASMTIGE